MKDIPDELWHEKQSKERELLREKRSKERELAVRCEPQRTARENELILAKWHTKCPPSNDPTFEIIRGMMEVRRKNAREVDNWNIDADSVIDSSTFGILDYLQALDSERFAKLHAAIDAKHTSTSTSSLQVTRCPYRTHVDISNLPYLTKLQQRLMSVANPVTGLVPPPRTTFRRDEVIFNKDGTISRNCTFGRKKTLPYFIANNLFAEI